MRTIYEKTYLLILFYLYSKMLQIQGVAMIKSLPKSPGIYLFKNKDNRIIYVGKAKSIRDRVNTYFQKRNHDWKVTALLDEHDRIDYIATNNETEALLLEVQLIRDNQPKYNVLLRDGQPFLYILFTQDSLPKITLVRNKKKKGTYFGPFLHKTQARKAHEYLVKTFRLQLCNKKIENGCLEYHLNICAGSCKKDFDQSDYTFRLQLAIDALKNNHQAFIEKIKAQITLHNKNLAFEKAQHLNTYLENIDAIFNTLQVRFSVSKFATDVFIATTPLQQGLHNKIDTINKQLQEFLQLDKPVSTVDCFDVSHFQSSYLTGSCVRFTHGIPDKQHFRRFRIKTLTEQNDYAALQEIVTRRYKDPNDIPDVILIDGGKGQLNAVQSILPHATCISLAKREETIFSSAFPQGVKLDIQTPVGQLLIALRDYAHHFAISYHRKRRSIH